MTSLVITKNDPAPLYGDWNDDEKRQRGQIFTGERMLMEFAVPNTDVGAITYNTLRACLEGDFSIWLRYDGGINDSFAIITSIKQSGSFEEDDEEEFNGRALRTYNIDLDYVGLKPGPDQTPIVEDPSEKGKLKLQVREDSPPKSRKNKKMNVTIPSDFALFDTASLSRKQYLVDMAEDVRTLTTDDDDVDYLLSSLTFRRCL